MTAHYTRHGPLAVITLDNPSINALNLAARQAIMQGLQQAEADATVQAVILTGSGQGFSGGADIAEFETGQAYWQPHLRTLMATIEELSKPVLAALHGNVLGGGLELALACHYRVAVRNASVALPEVKLGLLPGAGGTQRLPRAIGVESALNLIVSGQTVSAQALAALPGQVLFDAIVEHTDMLLPRTKELAHTIHALRPLPRLRDRRTAHPQAEAYFEFARNTVRQTSPYLPAPLCVVDAIAAACSTDFDAGLAQEQELFLRLMQSPESHALRHLFAAERLAGKVPDIPAHTPTRPIESVAIVGAGTMGSGIAIVFLDAGLNVMLLDHQAAALERGMATIRAHYHAQEQKGRISPEQQAQTLARLHTHSELAAIRTADLVIEAVLEDIVIKKSVFAQLDAHARPGAILATNTSTLDVNDIATATQRPQDVLGLHFFSPAPHMKLLEVVRGTHTAPDVLTTALTLAKAIRKTAVVAGVCDGFIGNRMIFEYSRQAGLLLDEGASPQQVDRAMEAFGFAMGPFRMMDLAGNDIAWAILQRHLSTRTDLRHSPATALLVQQHRLGQKTHAGWYDYRPDDRKRQPHSSDAVHHLLAQNRTAQGITPRTIADDEIVQRLVFALVNEAAHILEEGIAQRASDIDLVFIYGYGFPYWRGGPLHHADTIGLPLVVQAMRRFARNPHDDAAFWQPAPLLLQLAQSGKGFAMQRA